MSNVGRLRMLGPAAPTQVSAGWIGVALAVGLVAGILPWAWLIASVVLVLPMIHPVFGLALLLLSVTAQDSIRTIGGLSLTQVAIPLTLAGWSMYVLSHPKRRLELGRTAAAWGVFLTILLLATAFSPYSATEGLKELWRWGAAFLAWLIGATTLRRPWHIAVVVGALLIAPTLNAGLGVSQFWAGDGPAAFRISQQAQFVRAYGTIGQPNSFAGYMNLAWPMALALALGWSWQVMQNSRTKNQACPERSRREPRTKSAGVLRVLPKGVELFVALLLWGIAALLIAALIVSFSRGAWLGAAMGLGGMLVGLGLLGGRWVLAKRWVLVAFACLGIVLLVLLVGGSRFLPPVLAGRIESTISSLRLFDPSSVVITDQNFAVVERMAQMWAGWQMFLAHPLLGVGPGNYNLAYPAVASSPWFASRGHAHNYYLHIAAEAGMIGLASYSMLLAMVMRDLWHALQKVSGSIWRGMVVGACGIIAAMMGHNLFENLHVLHLSIQSAAVWGMIAALTRRVEEQ